MEIHILGSPVFALKNGTIIEADLKLSTLNIERQNAFHPMDGNVFCSFFGDEFGKERSNIFVCGADESHVAMSFLDEVNLLDHCDDGCADT